MGVLKGELQFQQRVTLGAAELGARSARCTNLAIIVVSVYFADKAIVDFNFLIFEACAVFHGFMDQVFLISVFRSSAVSSVGWAHCLTRVTHFPTPAAVSFSFAMAA